MENEIARPVFKNEDNRLIVMSLPWKENYLLSSSNYPWCETRPKTLPYKLKDESNQLSDCHEIIKDQEIKRIVERVN